MPFEFTKMHGLGNDYIYVDCFRWNVSAYDLPNLSRAVSDRHRGIGSDGLILIYPPSPGVEADCRMEMYNADGSRGEMCGNGIRCVAKYFLDNGLCGRKISPEGKELLRVQTDRGVLELQAYAGNSGKVERVRVNMGAPILSPLEIPVHCETPRAVRMLLQTDCGEYPVTCVSMGNPHAVHYREGIERVDLTAVGPKIENHPSFPRRINFHLAQAHSRREVRMKTWERGSGITQACGTGACAVLVAGVLEDRLDRTATVHLPGGDLEIEWSTREGDVFMTGPAVAVFSGTWPNTGDLA